MFKYLLKTCKIIFMKLTNVSFSNFLLIIGIVFASYFLGSDGSWSALIPFYLLIIIVWLLVRKSKSKKNNQDLSD